MSNGTEESYGGDEVVEVAGGEGNGNIHSPERTLELAAQEVWTSADLEEAEPCAIIEVSDEEVEEAIRAEEEAPEPTGRGEGIAPAGPPETAEEEEEEGPEGPVTLAAGYAYPPPFTRHNVIPPYTTWPYRTVGKLFFKQGNKSFVCSASSIGGCAIWTAGHCLHSGNGKADGWSTNVVFVPAYRNGNAPYGQWPAKQLWVRTAWYKNGIPKGLCQDMGGAILFKQGGKKISQRVGWLGFAWNWSRVQHWHSLGYPAEAPFDGQLMVENEASYAYDGTVGCQPKPVGMGNDLTGGSSGGPLVWRFGTANYLNGNNSYRRKGNSEEMFSPYFGNHAKSLWDELKKGTC